MTSNIPPQQEEPWQIEVEIKEFIEGTGTTVAKARQNFLVQCRGYVRSGTCCPKDKDVTEDLTLSPAGDYERFRDYIDKGSSRVSLVKDKDGNVSGPYPVLLTAPHPFCC